MATKLTLAVLLGAVVPAGCGASGSTGAKVSRSGSVTVAYRSIAISPEALTVHVGTTIRWVNFDATPHNVTSTGGAAKISSPDFGKGGSFEFKPSVPGVIDYICSIHPASMAGKITVVK